jgi:hypothetical protein
MGWEVKRMQEIEVWEGGWKRTEARCDDQQKMKETKDSEANEHLKLIMACFYED